MEFRSATPLFFAMLAAEIFAVSAGRTEVEFVAKPALMIILAVYFTFNSRGTSAPRIAIICALAFSWFGDVLLLFDKISGGFFVYGLAAFLAAHLCYIAFFLVIRKLNGRPRTPNLAVLVGIAFYTAGLFGFVAPFAGEMLVPVAAYSIVISTMLASGISAFDLMRDAAGRLCVLGSALFVVSDSILAVNRFAIPFAAAPALVMLTYGIAQWLICEGARRTLASRK